MAKCKTLTGSAVKGLTIEIVALLLLLNIHWRFSSSVKPLPSRNHRAVPTSSIVLHVARYKLYFTYLLTYSSADKFLTFVLVTLLTL